MGSLESCRRSREGLPFDFSENNLANHMASRLDYEGMAPSELARAYFARWEGPVLESDGPVSAPGPVAGVPARRAPRAGGALPARRAAGPLDNAAVKWAVMTYGGVDAADRPSTCRTTFWDADDHAPTTQRHADASSTTTSSAWAGTTRIPAAQLHAAARRATAPSSSRTAGARTGATEGYFWISYYDANFGQALAVFRASSARATTTPSTSTTRSGAAAGIGAGGGESAWFASRFTCAGSGDRAP